MVMRRRLLRTILEMSLGGQDGEQARGQHMQRHWGLPGGSDGKESPCNAGGPRSIPGSGRFPGGGHGNPLQYSHLENATDRGAWQPKVPRVAKSRTGRQH